MKDEGIVSISALAKVCNVSERRLQQLEKEGVTKKAERGKWFLIASVNGYVKYLQKIVEGSSAVIDFEQAKKRKIHAEAGLAELELARAKNSILLIKDHGEIIGKVADSVKARLLAIPSKLAPSVALEANQNICKTLIEDEIRRTLTELARVVSDDSGISKLSEVREEEAKQKISSTSQVKRSRVGRPRKGSVA
jgi:phage terminase Nu1 subunit (DNA packaging protein)